MSLDHLLQRTAIRCGNKLTAAGAVSSGYSQLDELLPCGG